ncbi:hypothetical protein WJ41_13750 [Burkholderia ubonensis]|nr:hypothetical protein WJ41_13750 [Burkholderia ubonensis]KVU04710.1 hypothetical protein WK61_02310 [Burkholderia ubonensis]
MTPLIWDNEERLTSGHQEFAREAISFGLRRGVTFPVHTKYGDIGLLSLACDIDRGRFFNQLGNWISQGVLISVHAQEALSHISIASQRCVDLRLTHREASVLQWVALDKSTWEIAQILALSEHGVTHHLRRIMNKLEVDSRHKAVSRAIELGLI